MTSSTETHAVRPTPLEPLPPALSSMWRLCKLGYQHEPRLMLVAFVLSQVAVLPDALLALWLMLLGRGILEQQPGLVRGAAIGLRSEEHTSELQSLRHLVCRLLLEK